MIVAVDEERVATYRLERIILSHKVLIMYKEILPLLDDFIASFCANIAYFLHVFNELLQHFGIVTADDAESVTRPVELGLLAVVVEPQLYRRILCSLQSGQVVKVEEARTIHVLLKQRVADPQVPRLQLRHVQPALNRHRRENGQVTRGVTIPWDPTRRYNTEADDGHNEED